MTLPVSGAISLGDVNVELQRSATATISMNDAELRTLFAVSSGAISLATGYGRANKFPISITSNQTNFNLRDYLVANGWNQVSKAEVTINSGVLIYATTTSNKALTISGSFPGGVEIFNNGNITGHSGGGGGASYATGGGGGAGGTALYTTVPLTLTNNGLIAGGGGGGGVRRYAWSNIYPGGYRQVASGGGGKGQDRASGNTGGAGGGTQVYTYEYTGYCGRMTGGTGGTGGTWGNAGANGAGGYVTGNWGAGSVSGGGGGGAGGKSVEGNANITWLVTGTIYGSQT